MKSRILLGLALLGVAGGEAAAQCAAGTQVQNVNASVAQVVVTFNGSLTGGGGTLTVAGLAGAQSGNRPGTDQATAFANGALGVPAGSAPPNTSNFTFTGTYNGWNAGPVSGSTVTYTNAANQSCASVTFPTPTTSDATRVNAPTMGACTDVVTVVNNLTNLLNLSLVCGRPGANYPGNANDRWQEQHRAGNELWDYKMGPGHPRDPVKQVGTWSISGTGAASMVTHSYFGPSFPWTVHNNVTHYSFCTGVGGLEHVRAYITTPGTLATASCGGSYPP